MERCTSGEGGWEGGIVEEAGDGGAVEEKIGTGSAMWFNCCSMY